MNETSDPFERIRELTLRVLEGEAGDADRARLADLLRDAEARRIYLETVDAHSRLIAQGGFPRPRLIAERIIYERVEMSAGAPPVALQEGAGDSDPPLLLPGAQTPTRRLWPILAATASLVAGLTLFIAYQITRPTPAGTLLEGSAGVYQPGDGLPWGAELLFSESGLIETAAGYRIRIESPAQFILQTPAQWQLKAGRIEVSSNESRQNAMLRVPGATLRARQARWTLEAVPDRPALLFVAEGQVTLEPDHAAPRHYWPMDRIVDGRIQDSIGSATGTLGSGVTADGGLAGSGALAFNNTPDAFVSLGSGGGEALATGSFAMDQAITFEILFASHWSGKTAGMQDETDAEILFRKQDPKGLIMLLQMKHYQKYPLSDPPVETKGPVMCFGLYLIGPGYGELTVPLDGQEGRPSFETVTDGKPHHLAATYDSRSGLKALYFDGQLIASHRYTPGSRILSGGPGEAHIGNSPVKRNEPFTGVLDELAVYDFPLSARAVREHAARARSGKNYFGQTPGQATRPLDRYFFGPGMSTGIDPDHGFPLDPARP